MDTAYLGPLLRGSVTTIKITVLAGVVALILAFLAGFAGMSARRPLRWLGTAYVETFRGTSLLVQMFWFFYALPLLGVSLSPLAAGAGAIGLNIGAYGAEVVRGSVQGVAREQTEAAIALNMPTTLRLRKVIMPQALVTMIPPFGNLAIEMLKGTALASLITLSDLTFEAQVLRNLTGDTVPVFTLVLLFYFAIAGVITLLVRLTEHRATRYLRVGTRGRPR